MLTHGSLFSGIGGFDLAAQRCGFQNIFQCEIDSFCQKVLVKNFPNTTKFHDIREFDATDYQFKIDVLTGGFPCQPFSVAGKQRGSEDDRSLWSEMFRVIQQIKPTYIIAENVRGLLTTENGLVFGQAISDLENATYSVQPFLIPACSVNAPHERQRLWIIAYSDGLRLQKSHDKQTDLFGHPNSDASNTQSGRCNSSSLKEHDEKEIRQWGRCGLDNSNKYDGKQQWAEQWNEVAAELCRMGDGLPSELDKLRNSNRTDRLKGLGNAIVPQVAFNIFQAVSYSFSNCG
jgi:DNA (cytosine-5)-methyltransferase 1